MHPTFVDDHILPAIPGAFVSDPASLCAKCYLAFVSYLVNFIPAHHADDSSKYSLTADEITGQ